MELHGFVVIHPVLGVCSCGLSKTSVLFNLLMALETSGFLVVSSACGLGQDRLRLWFLGLCLRLVGLVVLWLCLRPQACVSSHGWEIAVILLNFRKTKLSKSNFLLFFFYSTSTYIQCATRQLSLCDIHKYRFPAFYGTSDRQAAIFF